MIESKDIIRAVELWHEKKCQLDNEKAKAQAGILRGGSSGCMIGKRVYGTCPRIALSRSWGTAGPFVAASKRFMFESGIKNEDTWMEILEMGLPEYKALPEGEVVGRWGIPGTNREVACTPDTTIATHEGEQVARLEHKMISSIWTARSVSLKKIPKKEHLIQTAHSMWVTRIPRYILLYTQAVNFEIPTHRDGLFNFPDSSIIMYDGDYPLRIVPHFSSYDIDLAPDGSFWFKHHTSHAWIQTKITVHGIMEYFKAVHEQEETKTLMGPPSTGHVVKGATGDSSKRCGTCKFNSICGVKGQNDVSFDEFKTKVLELKDAKLEDIDQGDG